MMGYCCRDLVVWEYAMRREMQEIVPGLYLGPYLCATRTKLDLLLSHGITHIICIRHILEANFIRANFPERLKYLTLEIANKTDENILRYIPRVNEFINEALESGGKVLVHGNAGISRCAAITIAYLMETFSVGVSEAFSFVQLKRMCINPNEGFIAQLREFEPIYRAKQMFRGEDISKSLQQSMKRPFHIFLQD